MIIIDNEVEQENYTRQLAKAIIFVQNSNPSNKFDSLCISLSSNDTVDTQHFKSILTSAFKSLK